MGLCHINVGLTPIILARELRKNMQKNSFAVQNNTRHMRSSPLSKVHKHSMSKGLLSNLRALLHFIILCTSYITAVFVTTTYCTNSSITWRGVSSDLCAHTLSSMSSVVVSLSVLLNHGMLGWAQQGASSLEHCCPSHSGSIHRWQHE